ncbi:MAG: acetylornithine deacetylase [Gammaproteobacteria bacterium]|nr:acetylornithine deacetylase [Gammaproteobacteria bacterium]NIN39352.1 acetylornithine deacetylase [Gammaproteobacteria bacterium]NIO25017.1 acetylornithine deacetylase [Gammaproteobacteria bacterium]NIO65649.1 acetylornithine deacetylase [Gammaproteobacteria bacterium]NIP45895.1 acetylornithine deacetylase [Gammaproteobacteria bacterium]
MSGRLFSPVQMIEALVRFDTTSRESNLELIRFVEDYLKGHGVDSRLVFNDDRSKANLVASIGPEASTGGVVLSGHSDVVPVDGQDWSSDPFRVVERDGRLYGRGTCDMKGFLGIVLALVPEFQSCGLRAPVHIVLTYDEETDCSGAARLMRALPDTGLAARAVIIGEPTEMRIVNAHKGQCSLETVVVGREAHSSTPQYGVNAIDIAVRLIAYLASLSDEFESLPLQMNGVAPPFSTINVGTIRGGQQFNIVPAECRFEWEIRAVPGHDVDDILARFNAHADAVLANLRDACPEAAVRTTVNSAADPFVPEDDSPAETLVKALAGSNEAGALAFGTEAPFYQKAGMSVVVFGPGSIAQAHKPDEYISLEQVEACATFMRRLMGRLASEPQPSL